KPLRSLARCHCRSPLARPRRVWSSSVPGACSRAGRSETVLDHSGAGRAHRARDGAIAHAAPEVLIRGAQRTTGAGAPAVATRAAGQAVAKVEVALAERELE